MAKKRKKIEEKDGIHKNWYEEARKQTEASLPKFIKHLTQDYEHDYGTICHAVAAAAIAAASAVNHSEQGGITGFQAGAVMWEFVSKWMQKEGPMRLVEYKDLLYPQYATNFKSISRETWNWVQDQAKKNLASKQPAHEDVKKHWTLVAAGHVPFGLKVEKQ